MYVVKCLQCKESVIKPNKGKYCSRACYTENQKNNELLKGHLISVRPNMSGSKNPAWKGDNVGYGSLHDWVSLAKGKPNFCDHCKSTSEKKYEWANISKEYKRELKDWLRLCTSCHNVFDGLTIKVEMIENGVVIGLFNSVLDAERKTGVNRHSIYRCIHGEYRTAGGFKWRRQNA